MSSVIGIDEVGRGCLAGPLLVVAARNKGKLPKGLKDSKLLSSKQRNSLAVELEKICEIGEGWVSPLEIDSLGLSDAMRLAVKRALVSLGTFVGDQIIIDGKINYCPEEYNSVQPIVDADGLIPIVSAASIIAKVKRDSYMKIQSQEFPQYGFEFHVGYGTKIHLQAIRDHGICSIHRTSFSPIKSMI